MLNLKKVIALVCVFALALSTVAFGATYTDVAEDSAYYEAVETLTKLGIAKGTSETAFEPEAGVTRAQMAAFIARIQGYGETAEANAATSFKDVPADYWASGYIASAEKQKIINGYGDGNFGPEDPVKYEQAVKMIMATLGYTPFAEHNGGFPTGYLAAAQRYDVSLNVANAAIGTNANRGTIAQLLAKAIDTPLMEQVRWSTDGTVDYVICDGQDKDNNYIYKTLMSENLGYVKIRGVVMENSVTSIDTAKTINTEDEAKVRVALADTYSTNNKDFKKNAAGGFGEDGKTEYSFLVAGTDAEDFLGQSVVFYAKKVRDTYEIVSMNVDTVRNDVLVIAPDQFNGYNSTTKKLEYYKEGANDVTTIVAGRNTNTDSTLEAVPYVVYNGVGNQTLSNVLGGYVDNLAACKEGGQIKLIDNDSTAGYDVIFVELAGTAVVEEGTNKLVSFKEVASMPSGNVSRIKIDEDDTSKIVKIMKDGAEISASELAEWDVLSILADGSNAKYIVAEVISNPVVGTISGWFESNTSVDVDSDGDNDGYIIGGNKYDVVENVYGAADFKVGAGGTFYVNKYGKIAAFVEDKALALGVGANYGYVLDVASDTSFGKEIKVQMITADGVQVLTIKDNCTLEVAGQADTKIKPSEKQAAPNDAKYVWGCDSDDVTNKLDASTYNIKGLVQYTKTSEGYINSIKTPGHDAKLPAAKGTPGSAFEFDAEAGRFESLGGNINIDDDAKIFFVDAGNVASKCSFGTYANLVDKIPYTIVSYFADDDAATNNIFVARPVSAVSPAAGLAVITGASLAYDDNGDSIYEVSYLLDGEEVTAKTIAAADLSSTRYSNVANMPAKGDVAQVEVNSEGVITGLKCVAYYAGGTLTLAEAAGTKEAYVLGTAKDFNKTKKIMTFEGATSADGDDVEFNFNRATKVYVIDATGRNVSIDVDGIGAYGYFKDLYTCTDKATHTFTVDGVAGKTHAQAVAATDLVLVRFYDDDEAEAVIVKSATEDIVADLATGC